jgi:hypothetical protein
MYGIPRVACGFCGGILLTILENITSAVGSGEIKAKDMLKTEKVPAIFNP